MTTARQDLATRIAKAIYRAAPDEEVTTFQTTAGARLRRARGLETRRILKWDEAHHNSRAVCNAQAQAVVRLISDDVAAMREAAARIVEAGREVPDPLDNSRSTVMEDWEDMEALADAIRALPLERKNDE